MKRPTVSQLPQALADPAADKRLEVLRRVGQTGSISQAAREAGISYKAAWQAIDTLTNLSGVVLVDRSVGGSGGGGARITDHGRALLALADALAAARQAVLARHANATGPGDGLAGALGVGGALSLRTSMRNLLSCRVSRLEAVAGGDFQVRVVLTLAEEAPAQELAACITRESAELLALTPGLAVLALCKATAVRLLPHTGQCAVAESAASALNGLPGRVARISLGQARDEAVLALPGGQQLVGFADPAAALAEGTLARACFAENAVVLALP